MELMALPKFFRCLIQVVGSVDGDCVSSFSFTRVALGVYTPGVTRAYTKS